MLHEKSKEVSEAILCNGQLPPGMSVPNCFIKKKTRKSKNSILSFYIAPTAI